tara:strand:+ start:14721 stop:16547 length:1827 start_codon:yes stop_codon:yes gene_type:complete
MDERLLYFTAILTLGIFAQWLAWRLKLPSILLLLGFGFAAGQIYDQSAILEDQTLFAVVSMAVAIILLEGGLTLRLPELKEAGKPVLRLVTTGAAVTWLLTIPAAHYAAGFSWPVATLVAAILVVTGPTVIGPILRTLKPVRSINSILKWEGIVIDPVGAVLTVLVFSVLFGHGESENGAQTVITGLAKTLIVGFGLGFGVAWMLVKVLKHHWIPDFLQSVVILTAGLIVFAISNMIQHESGLLTVTVLGIGIANQSKAQVRHIIEFKENLRIILISALFIILGGRVSWAQVTEVWKEAVMFLCILIVVVRPAAVFISTMGSKVSRTEKVFLALMAPRGIVAAAVCSIFSLEIIASGGHFQAEGEKMVPIVFTVIVGTVLFYGLSAGPIARRLGVASKRPQGVLFTGIRPWVIEAAKELQSLGFRCLLVDSNYAATSKARMAGLQAVNANVLSEFAHEELDLSGIGSMLAVTPNDQVNSLACLGFAHALGRSNVYQLAPADMGESERKSGSGELRGRILFSGEGSREQIRKLESVHASVKKTLLTDEFGWEDFFAKRGDLTMVLFILRDGELKIMNEESRPGESGDTLISLVVEDSPVVPTGNDAELP